MGGYLSKHPVSEKAARAAADRARLERAIDRLIRALRHTANAVDVESLRWRAGVASPSLHAHAVRHAVRQGLVSFEPHHSRSHRGLIITAAGQAWAPGGGQATGEIADAR